MVIKIIDWIGKNLGRIKTVGSVILILSLIVSLSGNGCSKRSMVEMTKKLTGLDLENLILRGTVEDNEKTILRIEAEKDTLRQAYSDLRGEKDSLQKNEVWFKGEYWRLRKEIAEMSEDSSYNWLQRIAYPFGGDDKPFGFNGPQVKAIHLDKVDYNNKVNLVGNLELQLVNCETRNNISQSLADSTEQQLLLSRKSSVDQKQVISNLDEEIELKDELIQKEHRAKRLWKGITIAVVALETTLLIIL